MVYKRYIYRNGKRFGPYYYQTYRDKDGKTHSKYIEEPKEPRAVTQNKSNPSTFKQHKTLFILLVAIAFIFIALIVVNQTISNSTSTDVNQRGFSFKNLASNVKSFFTGLTSETPSEASPSGSGEESTPSGDSGGSPAETPTTPTETTPGTPAESTPETPTETIPEGTTETPSEPTTTPPETPTEETPSETSNETTQEPPIQNITEEPFANETSEGPIANETTIPETNESISNETTNETITPNEPSEGGVGVITNATNQTISNETISIGNITEILNETNFTIIENVTNMTIVNATVNITTQENVIQYTAVLGKPVKWEKKVKVNVDGADSTEDLVVDLPSLAGNVSVKKTKDGTEEELDVSVKNEKTIVEGSPGITGSVTAESGSGSIFSKFFNFILGFFSRGITGRAVDVSQAGEDVKVSINEPVEDNSEISIEYYTNAPYAEEQDIKGGKQVKIIGPSEIHYENVLAFTNLSEELNVKDSSKIKIYWEEESSYIIPEKVEDLDANGIYDYVEWAVPHLSNQTFDIIIITKAEHLDENRSFISDIYNEVKDLDNVWSETIPSGDYVRVTFEHKLDSSRDITLYPRIISGSPKIEVYEKDGSDLIAEFSNITSNSLNKVYLINLGGSQDVFDLRVLDGSLDLDYIVDPTPTPVTYLPNMTNQKSYYGSDASNPPTSPYDSGPTELASADYGKVSLSDNSRASVTDVALFNGIGWNWIEVTFKINESSSTLNNLTFTFEGYNDRVFETVAQNDLNLYVYNFTASSWGSNQNTTCQNSACNDTTREKTMTFTLSASTSTLSHYVNSSGHVRFLADEYDNQPLCPVVYSWNGIDYVPDHDAIKNLSGKEKETLQINEVRSYKIENNLLNLQVRELLNETSYLDNVYLIVKDKYPIFTKTIRIKPSSDNLDKEDLGLILRSDDKYLKTKQGDIVNLSFENIPKENKFSDRKIYLAVEGYFVLNEKTHNTLYIDLMKLDLNYNLTDNPPTWLGNSTNSSVKGSSSLHSVAWSDNSLSGYIFSFNNGNGTLINDSWVSMNGASNWSNVTKTLNSSFNSQIQWKVFVNDSANQWNSTDAWSYSTTDTAPTHGTPSLSPYPLYLWQNLTCSNQSTADVNGDSVTNIYNWLVSGTPMMLLNLPFDTNVSGTVGVKDYSGNAYNATINGTPVWTSLGKVGGAYSFNTLTTDYLVVPNNTLSLGSNFTINFWFNLTYYPQVTFMDEGFFAKGNYSLGISLNWNAFDALGPLTRINGSNLRMVTSPSINVWYMYSLACDTINCTIYINGTRENQSSVAPSNLANYNLTIGLGRSSTGAASGFNGSIDDFRIYNRTLSSQQVYQIYQDTKSGLSSSSTIVSGEMLNNQNMTCQITPNDAILDGTTNINFTLMRDASPTVSLVYPATGTSYTGASSVMLQCNATDDLEIKNISLYINTTGTWHNNQTKYPELPNNGIYDSYNNLNMSKNILLLHFNNDTSVGESSSYFYDFSGRFGLNGPTNPPSIVSGKFDKSASFDGTNDNIQVANFNLSDVNKTTVAFWVYPNGTSSGDDVLVELSNNFNSYTDSFIVFFRDDEKVEIALKGDVGYNTWVTTSTLPVNTWTFVTAIFDKSLSASESKGYINGILDGATNPIYDSNNGGNFGIRTFYIASRVGAGSFFNGTIDELAVWNRSLSAAEIQGVYNISRQYYANFSVTGFGEGSYNWSCQAYDNSSQSSFASSNWTFSTDVCGITQVSSSTTLTSSRCEHYNITANNVVFDCAGYTINGNSSLALWGIDDVGYNNLSIKNCYLERYVNGIRIFNSNNSVIQNTTLYNISWFNSSGGGFDVYGIKAESTYNLTIKDSNLTSIWANTSSTTCGTGNLFGVYLNNSVSFLLNTSILNNVSGHYYADTQGDTPGCQGGYFDVGAGVYTPDGSHVVDPMYILRSNLSVFGSYATSLDDVGNISINDSRFSFATYLVTIAIGGSATGGNINIYNNQVNYSTSRAISIGGTGSNKIAGKVLIANNQISHHVSYGIYEGDLAANGVEITNNYLVNASSDYIYLRTTNLTLTNNMVDDNLTRNGDAGVRWQVSPAYANITNNTILNMYQINGYAFILQTAHGVNISGLNITNCVQGFLFAASSNVSLTNSTISNCNVSDVLVSSANNIQFYNVSFNKSRSHILSSGFLEVYYLLTGNTTDQGYNAVSSASVNVTDKDGNYLILNNQTSAGGLVSAGWIMEYNQTGNATYAVGCTGSASGIACATPHNLSASKTGYGFNFTSVTMNVSKMVHLILYTPVILAYVPTTDNFSIAEPNNQTFSITYSNITPVNIKWFINGSRQTSYDNNSQFIWVGNYTQQGNYSIKVNISASSLEDDQTWLMRVNDTSTPPTHTNPSLSPFPGVSNQNLSCYNQSTSSPVGNSVSNVYNWLVNGSSMLLLNMPFDLNSATTARDYSGFGNNATLFLTTWTSSGKIGGALDFDGVSSSAYMISSSSLNSTSSGLTVAFWVKPKNRVGVSNDYYIWKGSSSPGMDEYYVRLSNQKIFTTVYNQTGSASTSLLSNNNLSTGTFYFVAFTYNNSFMTLYINGSLENSTATTYTMKRSNMPVYLGIDINDIICIDCYTNMTLDNLMIYNRSLTSQQIYQIYQDTKSGLSNSSTLVNGEFSVDQNLTCEVTPVDSSFDGTTLNNWTVISQAFSVAMDLSPKLGQQINWSLNSLPAYNQSAEGNNRTGISEYWINITVNGGTADLYMKGESDLRTSGGDVLTLGNETYSNSTTDNTVPNSTKKSLTTNFADHLIGSGLGNTTIYLKFFLNAPAAQAAGSYNNSLSFRLVQSGEAP